MQSIISNFENSSFYQVIWLQHREALTGILFVCLIVSLSIYFTITQVSDIIARKKLKAKLEYKEIEQQMEQEKQDEQLELVNPLDIYENSDNNSNSYTLNDLEKEDNLCDTLPQLFITEDVQEDVQDSILEEKEDVIDYKSIINEKIIDEETSEIEPSTKSNNYFDNIMQQIQKEKAENEKLKVLTEEEKIIKAKNMEAIEKRISSQHGNK